MSNQSNQESPIILVGTHRSGTTFLGKVFSRHADLAYWEEPRHVWTWGNVYRPNDVLTAADVTPRIRNHVRRTFARYVRRHEGRRLCEKTPSNCLRLPFIREIYPEARIIMLIRDGRSVIRSTEEILRKGAEPRRILLRAVQTPIWEWPAYIPRGIRTVSRMARGRRLDFWGPRPPGWQEWLQSDPPNVVMAKQWSATISRALEDGRAMGSTLYHEIRYEELMREPRAVMEELAQFAGLPRPESMISFVEQTADAGRVDLWRRELTDATLESIRPHMEPVLNELGYLW